MQKIINGKRYDTETSTVIGEFTPDPAIQAKTATPQVMSPWMMMPGIIQIDATQGERLHRGRYGSWFTHRDDGLLTPLVPEQARAWMEAHNLTEEIPTYFSVSEA